MTKALGEYSVDFVYKTYHTARIHAESPEAALDQVMEKTYGVEPDWESDKDFLKETLQDDDPYNALSVEARVDCQFVWDVHTPDDYYCQYESFDSYEEAEKFAGEKYSVESNVVEFEKTDYEIRCKFAESGGISVELRPEHIATILPLLKGEIEGGRDSFMGRVAYNRLLLALDGEAARDKCYNPGGAVFQQDKEKTDAA
jgi:hypothetical protein